MPALIIMGARDDPRLFKDAEKLEKDIAGSSLVTIAETHHMPKMERPEEFNTFVLDFLARL
jgi:pimeloyl-ACP methyl ester carboxylesterase